MTGLSLVELDAARRDPVVFAEVLIKQPLWEHQAEVCRSGARYRVLCAGRRAGKTRVFGVLSLHRAFAVPRSKVMIVSASDSSSKRMFQDVSGMAVGSPHLRGSIADDTKSLLTLSNGSTIECVPASMKAVRSAEADLLIVDEAGFVDQDIWEAAEPLVGARPGSRVLISSTPWRGPGHFFHDLYHQGLRTPDHEVTSWNWPSTVSPNLDMEWFEAMRRRSSPAYFEREYLAEWHSTSGLLLTPDELMGAVLDYPLCDPADGLRDHCQQRWDYWGNQSFRVPPVVGGVDWGNRQDSNALVLVGVLDDQGMNGPAPDDRVGRGDYRFWVPWLEVHQRMDYEVFLRRIVNAARVYNVTAIASENNGVGAFPTTRLRDLMQRAGYADELPAGFTPVYPVWSDNRRKQTIYGKVKGLLQSGQLVLPRHPDLLKQLAALEVRQLPSGAVAIDVPENRGHDDLSDALAQAVSAIQTVERGDESYPDRDVDEIIELPSGTKVPMPPRLHFPDSYWAVTSPAGFEQTDPI